MCGADIPRLDSSVTVYENEVASARDLERATLALDLGVANPVTIVAQYTGDVLVIGKKERSKMQEAQRTDRKCQSQQSRLINGGAAVVAAQKALEVNAGAHGARAEDLAERLKLRKSLEEAKEQRRSSLSEANEQDVTEQEVGALLSEARALSVIPPHDQVPVGGETGGRPHPAWVRELQQACLNLRLARKNKQAKGAPGAVRIHR